MEQPPLQMVRDACADLARSENEEEAKADDEDEAEEEKALHHKDWKSPIELLDRADVRIFDRGVRAGMPRQWFSQKEIERKKRSRYAFAQPDDATYTDFGIP